MELPKLLTSHCCLALFAPQALHPKAVSTSDVQDKHRALTRPSHFKGHMYVMLSTLQDGLVGGLVMLCLVSTVLC